MDSLKDMVGPTDEAKVLQLEQTQILDRIYANPDLSKKDLYELNLAYDQTVEKLQHLLGEDAPCAFVDVEFWSTVSDLHKSVVGCRPGVMSLSEAREWMRKENESPVENRVACSENT